jgi:hypothetical protein
VRQQHRLLCGAQLLERVVPGTERAAVLHAERNGAGG